MFNIVRHFHYNLIQCLLSSRSKIIGKEIIKYRTIVTGESNSIIGKSVRIVRTFTTDDVKQFAELTGDHNPLHFDLNFAQRLNFIKPIVHGALINGIVSQAIGTLLPGPGSILIRQDLNFTNPLYIDEQFSTIIIISDRRHNIYTCNYECITDIDKKRLLSFLPWRMDDKEFLNNPVFKKKLHAVDELLRRCDYPFRWRSSLPSSPRLATIPEFKELLNEWGELPRSAMGIDCDVVYPNIIVGNVGAARNPVYLKSISVTHVLNTAQGDHFNQVSTNEEYYRPYGIAFKGLALDDIWSENISRYFIESSDWIDEALSNGGRVYVHCWAGLSRSVTIVLAYLIYKKGLSVEEAVKEITEHRRVMPNEGFLRALIIFDMKLHPQEKQHNQ